MTSTPTSLSKKFGELNDNLSYCNKSLKEMIEEHKKADFNLKIKEKRADETIDIEELQNKNIKANIEKITKNYKDDFTNLEKLKKYLDEERKKKDRLEEAQKNSRILNEVYEEINKNINQLKDECKKGKDLSIEKVQEDINNQVDDLYKEYERVLETKFSLIRNNYMKSATDTVFLTVKNLADTLQSSYAFNVLSYQIENEFTETKQNSS